MSTYQVRTLEEADQIIGEHERKTKTIYTLLQSTKNFGCVDIPDYANEENEVWFETVGVPYCGAPFYVAGLKILQCQSAKGKGIRRKKEVKHEKQKTSKRKKVVGRTHHKVGCTATIIMKEVIYYPEFQVIDHSKNNRIVVARHLKSMLKSKAQMQRDRIIYITVPGTMDHFGQCLLPNNNATPVKSNVKRLSVKNDFYGHNKPGNSRRVYYPIKQEMVQNSQLTKRLKVDEDNFETSAKGVREELQSIMALTYKPGTFDANGQLLKDLQEARQKYSEAINSQFYCNEESIDNNSMITTVIASHQVISNDASTVKDKGWESSMINHTATTQVIPGTATVVAVSSLPLNISTNNNSNILTLQRAATPSSIESTSQETTIFLEAMDAILNTPM